MLDSLSAVVLFEILPYLVASVFVVGLVYRAERWLAPKMLTGLRSVTIVPHSYGYSDVVKEVTRRTLSFYTISGGNNDRILRVGSLMFHYGIWTVLFGHLAMVVNVGLNPGIHSALAYYLGGVAGVIAVGGLAMLSVRRIVDSPVRSISRLGDYVALVLIFAVALLGLVNTLVFRPDFASSVSPWLVSLLSLRPEVASIGSIGIATEAHIIVSMLFIAYVPFGKMTHVISFLFSPTVTGRWPNENY